MNPRLLYYSPTTQISNRFMGARVVKKTQLTAELCADDKLECPKGEVKPMNSGGAQTMWQFVCLCFVSCCFVVVEDNVLLRGNVTNYCN